MKNQILFISFDLLFDYNSLFFSCLRAYFVRKDMKLKNNFKTLTEMKSPKEAYNNIINALEIVSNEADFKEFEDFFKEKLSTIKP